MGLDPAFAKSCAAAVAAAWLAILLLGLPAPREKGLYPWQRATPRLAVVGALAFGTLFAGIALWEHGSLPDLEDFGRDPDAFVAGFEGPARTLSSGAAFVAIAVSLTAAATAIGARSRTAARGLLLFALVLLAGAVWPVFSIPRWCAHLAAPEDLPEPSPLAAYRPDCDPASWLDAWARALHPLAAWGTALALAGAGAGFVLFRRATARADAEGRASACAGIALAGLLAVCGAALEFEKHAAWGAYESWVKSWTFDLSDLSGSFTLPPSGSPVLIWQGGVTQIRLSRIVNTRVQELGFMPWPCLEPDIPRPLPPAFGWIAAAGGLAAVLFGEFHLRGRRLLRDPVTNLPAPEAA